MVGRLITHHKSPFHTSCHEGLWTTLALSVSRYVQHHKGSNRLAHPGHSFAEVPLFPYSGERHQSMSLIWVLKGPEKYGEGWCVG